MTQTFSIETVRPFSKFDPIFDLSQMELSTLEEDSHGFFHSGASPVASCTYKRVKKHPSLTYGEVEGKLCASCATGIKTTIPPRDSGYYNRLMGISEVVRLLSELTEHRDKILKKDTSTLTRALKVFTDIADTTSFRYRPGYGRHRQPMINTPQLEVPVVKIWIDAFHKSLEGKVSQTREKVLAEFRTELLTSYVRPVIKVAQLDEEHFPEENQIIKDFQEKMVKQLVESQEQRLVKVRSGWQDNQAGRHVGAIFGPAVRGVVLAPLAVAARLAALYGSDVATLPKGLNPEQEAALMEMVGGLYDPDNRESAYNSLSEAVNAAAAMM